MRLNSSPHLHCIVDFASFLTFVNTKDCETSLKSKLIRSFFLGNMRLRFSFGVVPVGFPGLMFILVLERCRVTNGHGMLMEPPNRSSIWRFPEFAEFQPEENWTDNELYCGGFTVQHEQNGGKCGPCGDNYRDKRPRDNENGGRYGRGIIVRNYKPGQAIRVDVNLTTSHGGYFVFNLCPLKTDNELEQDECFEKYPLPLADGSESKYQYQLPPLSEVPRGWFRTSVKLPAGLTSPHAVLRWHYRVANTWNCENRTINSTETPTKYVCNPSLGPQETFRGCADISIGDYAPSVPRPPLNGSSTTTTTTIKPSVSTTTTTRKPNVSTTTKRPAILTSTTTRRPGTTIITLPPKPRPTGTPSSSTVKPPGKVPSIPVQHPPKPASTTTLPTTTTKPTTTARPSSKSTTTTSTTQSSNAPAKPPKHPVMVPPSTESPKNNH